MEFVRLLRSSGWHQARASRELGVSTATISRYVSGEQKPSLPVLRLFADSINDQLLLDGENPGQRAREGARFLDDWEHEVLAVFRRLRPEDRDKATGALSALLGAMMSASKRPTPRDPAAVGDDGETDDERHKRVADALGEALLSELDAARKARAEPTTSKESEQPPRDPSRSTTQRSVPGHRRSTT